MTRAERTAFRLAEHERTKDLCFECACGAKWKGRWVESAADIIALHRQRWNGHRDEFGLRDLRCGPVTSFDALMATTGEQK